MALAKTEVATCRANLRFWFVALRISVLTAMSIAITSSPVPENTAGCMACMILTERGSLKLSRNLLIDPRVIAAVVDSARVFVTVSRSCNIGNALIALTGMQSAIGARDQRSILQLLTSYSGAARMRTGVQSTIIASRVLFYTAVLATGM